MRVGGSDRRRGGAGVAVTGGGVWVEWQGRAVGWGWGGRDGR